MKMPYLEKKDDLLLIRARALCGAGRLAYFESDFAVARTQLEEAARLFRQAGDQAGAVNSMSSLMVVLVWQGKTAAALALLREGMTLLRPMQDRQSLLPVLSNFGWAASHLSAPEALADARALNEEVVCLARTAGDNRSLGLALACLAQCFYWMAEWATARPLYEESIPLLREVGAMWMLDYALWGLGQTVLRQGYHDEALAISREAMARQEHLETWIGTPYYLESFAILAVAEGQPERAVRLLAAAARTREQQHSHAQPLVVSQNEHYLSMLHAMLDEARFEVAWNEGRAMTVRAAVAYALEEPEAPAQASSE